MACITTQACALTFRTGLGIEIFHQFFADHLRFSLPVAAFHIGQNALEYFAIDVCLAFLVNKGELNLFLAASIEDQVSMFFTELFIGSIDGKAIMLSQRLQ